MMIEQLAFIDGPHYEYHVLKIERSGVSTILKVDLDAEGGPPYNPCILSMDGKPWRDAKFTRATRLTYKRLLVIATRYAIG